MKGPQLTPRHYAWLASALLLIQLAIEAVHAAVFGPWLGFGAAASFMMGALWCSVWLIAAVGVLLHRGWGGAFAATGALASLMHGIVILSAGNTFGLVYVAFGIVLIVLVRRASTWFGWDTFPAPAIHE